MAWINKIVLLCWKDGNRDKEKTVNSYAGRRFFDGIMNVQPRIHSFHVPGSRIIRR